MSVLGNRILVVCFLFTCSFALAADTPSSTRPAILESQKPAFVVWVHTTLSDWKDVLDTIDLERYFASQLDSCDVQNVTVASTAKVPNPAPANLFLLDISVDSLHIANRADWTGDRVFEVELSLNVKEVRSGQSAGSAGERYTTHFSEQPGIDVDKELRSAIYSAADRLSISFLREWSFGTYGDSLPAAQAPNLLERLPWWLLATGFLVVLAVAASVIGLVWRGLVAISKRWQRADDHYEQELNRALTLKLKTGDFSESACRAAAAAKRDEILAGHAEIERMAAYRLRHGKHVESYYNHIASRAARQTKLTKEELVDILHQATEWEFRVLQEAKRQATEAAQ